MTSLNQRAKSWHLDLDKHLNRFIPASPLPRYPVYISRFLGYRRDQEPDVGNVLGAWWSAVGAFCGLAVIAAVFNHVEPIQARHPPAMIASFGASAILEYNAIRSPLGQPRNAVLGHGVSALVGVGITKLFLHHPDFVRIKWIAGAVSCGAASAAMLLTGTVHPPGGASAVLAATDPGITAMGWYFVGLVVLGTMLMVVVGLVINNIQRQFPVYWWTPVDLRQMREMREKADGEEVDPGPQDVLDEAITRGEVEEKGREIRVGPFVIVAPADFELSLDEMEVLERLRERLRKRHDTEKESRLSDSSSAECMAV